MCAQLAKPEGAGIPVAELLPPGPSCTHRRPPSATVTPPRRSTRDSHPPSGAPASCDGISRFLPRNRVLWDRGPSGISDAHSIRVLKKRRGIQSPEKGLPTCADGLERENNLSYKPQPARRRPTKKRGGPAGPPHLRQARRLPVAHMLAGHLPRYPTCASGAATRRPDVPLKLVLDDLGDGAGGASLLARTAGNAGVLVLDLSVRVAELENARGAGVNANAAGNALVSINNWMGHDVFPSSLV